jgi:hypothetical protein
MVLLSKSFHASCSVGLAAALVAAIPPGRMARAENIIGGAFAPDLLDAAASEGAFRHLRALQDIASESGGKRAAGTLGYDRSAEYVAERLKEAVKNSSSPSSRSASPRSCLCASLTRGRSQRLSPLFVP